MLTLTKRQHSVGFSAMNADELYFINGGSGTYNHGGPSGSQGPTTGQKVGYVIARVAAEIVFIGHDNPAIKDAWAKGVSHYSE
ncbi:MAG: hypothetical protein K5829_13465 [Treponema sp.]|nr:hypothetical protein [Treponema sp.]